MKNLMRALTAIGLSSVLMGAAVADGHHYDGAGGGGGSHSSGGSSHGSSQGGGSSHAGGSSHSGDSWSGGSHGNGGSGGSWSGGSHHSGGSWDGGSGGRGGGTSSSSGQGGGSHSSGGSGWGGSSGSGSWTPPSRSSGQWDQGDHGGHGNGGGQGGSHGSGGSGQGGTHSGGDGGSHSAPGSWSGQSGHGHYGSNNNLNGGHGQTIHSGGNTITFGHGDTRGDIHNQVWRSDHLHFVHNDWRRGYWGYDHGFRDDFFFFGFYAFDPFGARCVVSPWYCYPNLPGYLCYDRVLLFGCAPIVFVGDPYTYHPIDSYSRDDRYNDVDYAIDDLTSLFNRVDRRSANRLVPRYDNVNIFVDGQYSYSISPNDFYDMLVDNATNTKTTRYTIEHVWRNRDGARVIARHEFEDPRGGTCTVWQSFVFEYERGNLVVREFGTSSDRPD